MLLHRLLAAMTVPVGRTLTEHFRRAVAIALEFVHDP
jgi:hypothetical protein